MSGGASDEDEWWGVAPTLEREAWPTLVQKDTHDSKKTAERNAQPRKHSRQTQSVCFDDISSNIINIILHYIALATFGQ